MYEVFLTGAAVCGGIVSAFLVIMFICEVKELFDSVADIRRMQGRLETKYWDVKSEIREIKDK